MTLATDLSVRLATTLSNALDLSTPVDALAKSVGIALANGTGLNQADLVFHDQRPLAASSGEDLDLAGGGLVGPLGGALTFARIKVVLIYVVPVVGQPNNVNVSRPASNGVPLFLAASDAIPVQPGGLFLWAAPTAAGVVVTPGTGDILRVDNAGAGTPVTYDVVIVGASA